MGHRQDQPVPCGSTPGCPGNKVTVYEYDDDGRCVSQQSFPCNICGRQ